MRTLMAALFLATFAANAQEHLSAGVFKLYEQERKDKAEALWWSAVLPGGGLFYTGQEELGASFLLARGLAAYWLIEADKKLVPALVFVFLYGGEMYATFHGVEVFNEELLNRLTVRVGVLRAELTFRL